MARFVFFSFAYEDVKNFKVNIVRNNWLMKNKKESFVDGSIWEESKTKGSAFLKKLIEQGLKNTSITTVLIGLNTANRRWVNYEIVKSFEKGNGLLAIHINRLKGKIGITKKGLNPLDRLGFQISEDGSKINFYVLKNRKWREFSDLKQINNKKSNSLYFDNHWWRGNEYGKFFKFSDKFNTKCWVSNDGNSNFIDWIEITAEQAGK